MDENTPLEKFFILVTEERTRQDQKWGPLPRNLPWKTWLAILLEEVGEVAKALLEHDDVELSKECIQCAAVIAAWMEDGKMLL